MSPSNNNCIRWYTIVYSESEPGSGSEMAFDQWHVYKLLYKRRMWLIFLQCRFSINYILLVGSGKCMKDCDI